MSALELAAGRIRDRPARPRLQDVSAPVAMLAFWAAIALPAIYLPLLGAGIDSVDGLVAFLGLFGLHVVALVLGREHGSPEA